MKIRYKIVNEKSIESHKLKRTSSSYRIRQRESGFDKRIIQDKSKAEFSPQKLRSNKSDSNVLIDTSTTIFTNVHTGHPLIRNKYHSSSAQKITSLNAILGKCEKIRKSGHKSALSSAHDHVLS